MSPFHTLPKNILRYKKITKSDRKRLNIFERKVYRRILGAVYDKEIESWRILTNREIYVMVKKKTFCSRDYTAK